MPNHPRLTSLGLFCGSAPGTDPIHTTAAAELGGILAAERVRLVYGGGGVGLMGAVARAVVAGGGEAVGVIPQFLCLPEVVYDAAEVRVVGSMHERKAVMFDEADAFAVLPGGIGTLEEAIEILSWGRLGLHAKPVVFVDLNGFWRPLFDLIAHTTREGFTPPSFAGLWRAVEAVDAVLPTLREMIAAGPATKMTPLTLT